MKITRPVVSEYTYIQRFLEDAYGHCFCFFPSTYPSVWKRQNTDLKNIFVIREKGEIVSLIRIFPLKTIQGGVDINLAGIGAIATLYSHRGKGYMKTLLQYALEEIKKQKFCLSVLGGDRIRYNNFGYENAGSVVESVISARGLKKRGIQASFLCRCDLTDRDIVDRIMDVSEKFSYRSKRTRKDFEELYKRQGVNVYYCAKGKKFAFLVVSATEVRDGGIKKVFEYGGDTELVLGILCGLTERFGFTAFSIEFPSLAEIPANLMSVVSSWSIESCLMAKIINLKQTMAVFAKRNDFLFPDNEEITLTIKNKESVVITKRGGVLDIVNGKGRNEIILTDTDMIRFLFGCVFWEPEGIDTRTVRILKQFLPLNIYLPVLDRI